MDRYDPFAEMNRMFEQMRTRMWTPEGMGRGDFRGQDGLRGRDGFLGGFGDSARGRGGINMDLKKHGDEYVFVADLPGFETEEIDLSFEDGALVVIAESQLSDEMTSDETRLSGDETRLSGDETRLSGDETMADETAHARTTADTDEIAVRREFTRSRRVAERVTIPEEVAEDEISATYRNGVSASSASGGSPDLQSGGVLEVHLPLVAREDAEDDSGKKIDIAD